MDAVNILAVLLSPLIAVLVTIGLQNRKERRDAKRRLFETLIATRHAPITEETTRALNMIDVVFSDAPRVRTLWREYFDMLGNPGLHNPAGWQQRQVKNLEMITAMAEVLGYGKAIRDIDVTRVYYPEGLGKERERGQAIADELLRVLRGSEGFAVAARLTSDEPTLPKVGVAERTT